MIPKWTQTDPKMIPKWSQNDPKLILKWSHNDPTIIQKWSQNDPRMITTWSQNDFKMIPQFLYYGPGDRPQKVIPGGAKTNESLWKSQHNVKKSILRFPTSLYTISLFPTFLYTIALVIERKKLSPEARKKTRASESLKITSKNQFYVSHKWF